MLRKIYHISNRGAKNLYLAAFWLSLYEIACALSAIPIGYAIYEMIEVLLNKKQMTSSIFFYIAASVIIIMLMYFSYRKMYKVKYLSCADENMNIRMNVADKLRKLPDSYLAERDLGDLTSTIMDDIGTIEGALTNSVAETISGIWSGIALLAIMAFINIKLTLCLSACLPVAIICMSLSKLISGKTHLRNRMRKLDVSESIQEYLDNIKSLKVSESMDKYQNGIKKRLRKIVPGLVLFEFLAGICISSAYNFMRLGIGIVAIFGAKMLLTGEISGFVYIVFLLMAVRVYEPLSFACENLGALIASTVAASRIGEILNFKEKTGNKEISVDNYDIEFSNVSFGYDDKEVLKNVSFVAKQGEYTALVGPSGSGKSTIAKLTAGFWNANEGSISIGGCDVSKIESETLYKNFSIVFQDVTLFHDTIYNNILIGNKNAGKEEVLKAAADAQCMSFIEKLPDGINTVIGENGHTLSGGERQRLSIARAFLKDAPVILLDESTASLDPETETQIQSAIERLAVGKTVLIIAHRLRTIEGCDKIIVLDDGKISGVGTHDELMNQCELYKKMNYFQRSNT